MKIEINEVFTPVVLTLETEQDLKLMLRLFGLLSVDTANLLIEEDYYKHDKDITYSMYGQLKKSLIKPFDYKTEFSIKKDI